MTRHLSCGLAVALTLCAAPLRAETLWASATETLPCLTASTDIAAFRAGFATAGWTEPSGPARLTALHTLGEIRFVVVRLPMLTDPESYANFIEASHADAEREVDWRLVMARDSLALGLWMHDDNGTMRVSCYIAGTYIPSVAEAMTRPEARLPDPTNKMFAALGLYSEEPELPGYDMVRYDWLMIDPPFDPVPPPLAAHSVIVSYTFQTANPPVPPLAPKP